MDELLEQFLLEGRDLVAQAHAEFAVLDRVPEDPDAIDGAFRAIHTLKGSVAIFAMGPAEAVLHAAEDILERARNAVGSIDRTTLSALVAAADQVDRWIDDMERSGALPLDAVFAADLLRDRLAAQIGIESAAPIIAEPRKQFEGGDWTLLFAERHATFSNANDRERFVFRYVPDASCFFRGEDPLAIAMAVPGLLALEILPLPGEWPGVEALEPFDCISALEGLTEADLPSVRAAFRMVEDQVTVAPLVARSPTSTVSTPVNSAADALRVPAARLDTLADGLGELLVAVNAVSDLARAALPIDRRLAAKAQGVQARLEQVTGRLQRELAAVRSVPLDTVLRRLPRLVREIAESLGKSVTLDIAGAELEVDKQIADGLFEPLLHLLRNAIDHGAEPPDQRKALGKAEDCRIALCFTRSGDSIDAVLSDDGRGMAPGRIRDAAVARGLLSLDEATALSPAATLDLIFRPGFSTADAVSAVSGRGVGMDAVRAAIVRLRGILTVDSAPGAGSTFRMRLPVSSLTTPLLIVRAGGEKFGVALDQISETARLPANAVRAVGGGRACVLRGHTVPVVSLGALVGVEEARGDMARMLVTQAAGDRVALRVDGFGERIDAFVRPSAGIIAAVPGVTGSAMMGDGSILLVLDLPELLA